MCSFTLIFTVLVGDPVWVSFFEQEVREKGGGLPTLYSVDYLDEL